MATPFSPTDDSSRSEETISLWRKEQGIKALTRTVSAEAAIHALAKLVKEADIDSLIPLASLLTLKAKPYTLKNHFPMEPLFNLNMSPRVLLKAGRQVSKSTSLATQGILMTARIPYFNTTFVTPLFEQTRRLSSNYVRPFLRNSLIGKLMMDSRTEDSVLQKTFLNESKMFFTHAFLDVGRARGIAADKLVIDEVQDIDPDFVPVLVESLSASEWRIQQYSGTPKTMDNNIQVMWEDSSQAEWITKCPHCGHWNVPNSDGGIIKMVQRSGLSCSKCGKTGLDPRTGHWQHMVADRFNRFAGYHIPQIILPMHYDNKESWEDLHEKKNKLSPAAFLNEVLGESCDVGTKLITLSELKEACKLEHSNEYEKAIEYRKDRTYVEIAIGVDWGGGGLREVSFTAAAIAGLRPDGRVDIIHMNRIRQGYKADEEASILLNMYWQFKCNVFAHDFGGAGAAREIIMIGAGLRENHIMPLLYVRTKGQGMITYKKGPRDIRVWWSLDKTRSLLFLTSFIRSGGVFFPQYKTCKSEIHDFLSLIEDKNPTRLGDIYVITKNPKTTDDIASAVNYAIMALFWKTNKWPNLAKQFEVNANLEALGLADPRLTGEGDVDLYNLVTQ